MAPNAMRVVKRRGRYNPERRPVQVPPDTLHLGPVSIRTSLAGNSVRFRYLETAPRTATATAVQTHIVQRSVRARMRSRLS